MKAILVEIHCVEDKKSNFCEMTEIAAVPFSMIDGITISGGVFHSYIRPVFLHWKLKRAKHDQYPNWWLAPTFTQVMDDFQQWMNSNGNYPWIVWNLETISIWEENASKHSYRVTWPSKVSYLKKELLKRNISLEGYSSKQEKQTGPYTVNKVNQVSELLSDRLPLSSLRLHLWKTPVLDLKRRYDTEELVVKRLSTLVEEEQITLEEISEWSRLSKDHLNRIISGSKKINKFERERLTEAWTMWETLKEYNQEWLDS